MDFKSLDIMLMVFLKWKLDITNLGSHVMNAKYSFCFGPFGMPSVNGIHSLPAA